MGYRCGLIAFQHKGRSLLALVVPKLWLTELDEAASRVCIKGTTLQILAHETERLPLRFSGPDATAWAALVEACLAELEGHSVESRAEPDESGDAPDAPDALGSLLQDTDLSRQLRSLLTLARGRRPSQSAWVDVSFAERSTPLTTWLDRLLRLVLYSRQLKEHRKDHSPADTGTGYLVDRGEHNADPLRFLTTHAFVEEVRHRQREVRQGYRIETASLGVIRGRITARGMARHAMSGAPQIECTYDEFTSRVPLFQVIVSALDHVARGGPFPAAYRELALVQELRTTARRLRRELAHIPSLPPATAAHLAGRVRLKRLQRPWTAALHMAKLLLQRLPLDFTAERQGQGALVWNVDTSKVWEGTLQQMLESDASWKANAQHRVPAPWAGLSAKKPDLVVHTKEATYILDAKYKDRSTGSLTPPAGEQYQVFAYSHLAQREGKKTRCGLLYATCIESTPLRQAGAWARNPGAAERSVDLVAVGVPFPRPQQVESDLSWRAWVAKLGKELRTTLLHAKVNERSSGPPSSTNSATA